MRSGEEPEATLDDVLDAYRAAAHAEADGCFDDRALEAQRQRILARLEQVGQKARVLPFPGLVAPVRPRIAHTRRWVSAAAAAGVLIGLVTGQLLHVMPGDNWVHREPAVRSTPSSNSARMAIVPAVVATSVEDNDLLDAIDAAVARHGARELRAFDDLTFGLEP